MKKSDTSIRALIVCASLLVMIFAFSNTANAQSSGIMGRIVDGKTASPWVFGAEIAVIEVGNGYLGSGTLSLADGTFSITYGSDPLGLCGGGCATPTAFAQIVVVIQFTCDLNTGNGSRPDFTTSSDSNCPVAGLNGLPNNISFLTIDLDQSGIQNLGDIDTNRGPTAVSLQSLSADGAQAVIPPAIALVGLVLAIGTVVVLRRRKQATY